MVPYGFLLLVFKSHTIAGWPRPSTITCSAARCDASRKAREDRAEKKWSARNAKTRIRTREPQESPCSPPSCPLLGPATPAGARHARCAPSLTRPADRHWGPTIAMMALSVFRVRTRSAFPASHYFPNRKRIPSHNISRRSKTSTQRAARRPDIRCFRTTGDDNHSAGN